MEEHGEHGHVVIARAVACLTALVAPSAASACGVALALGIDVSSSVDEAEHRLQRLGLAAAFREPGVMDAILGSGGAMATAYEWSGPFQQDVIVGWTWLDQEGTVIAFADAIERSRRRREAWPTALGRAVEFGVRLHRLNPRDCARRIIDISGDGVNNHGAGPDWYARAGILEGFTVNGLAIRGDVPDPADYYRQHLIYGPGAFLEVAEDFADFPRAIRRKLVRELLAPLAALEPAR